MFCQMFAPLPTASYGQGAWHMRMHEDICVLQLHTLRQMFARCPHPNRGRWHTSRRWWITRTPNMCPGKVSIVIFCHLFSHRTTLSFYDGDATNCVKNIWNLWLNYGIIDQETSKIRFDPYYFCVLWRFSSRVPRAAAVELARPIYKPSMERAALLNHPCGQRLKSSLCTMRRLSTRNSTDC